MNFKIITIPFDSSRKSFFEEELNKFCMNKKVNNYKTEFFSENGCTFWTVFIEYEQIIIETETKKDDEKGMDETEKALFHKLKEWRNETAGKNGIPPFIILKNSHLKEIVKKRCMTHESLKNIHGVGDKKVKDYGNDIVDIVKVFYGKEN